jgi:hypothetical protein
LAHSLGLLVVESSIDFFGCVQDESATHGDRLADWFATHEQELAAIGAGDRDRVTIVETAGCPLCSVSEEEVTASVMMSSFRVAGNRCDRDNSFKSQ